MKVVIQNLHKDDTVLFDSAAEGYAQTIVMILEDGQTFRLTEREIVEGRVLDVNTEAMMQALPRAANSMYFRSYHR